LPPSVIPATGIRQTTFVDQLGEASVVGGRFRLVESVGGDHRGGVWRAVDGTAGGEVAVKAVGTYAVGDLVAKARFRLAARAVLQLSAPGIAQVHDFGEADLPDDLAAPYLIRELVSGQTLDQRLSEGPLAAGDALRIVASVAGALAVAHRAGVPHGHVVPANIVLGPETVKVTDFGLSALHHAAGPGALSGLSYAAPELADGQAATPAADMYALGVVFVACLAGITSFDGTSAGTHAVWAETGGIGSDDPLDPRALEPVPAGLASLWAACLGPNPMDRPTAAHAAVMSRQVLYGSAASPVWYTGRADGSAAAKRAARSTGMPGQAAAGADAGPAQQDGDHELVPGPVLSPELALSPGPVLAPDPAPGPEPAAEPTPVAAGVGAATGAGAGGQAGVAGQDTDGGADGPSRGWLWDPPRTRSRRGRLIVAGGVATGIAAAAAVVVVLVSVLGAQQAGSVSSTTATRTRTAAAAVPRPTAKGRAPSPEATSSVLTSTPATLSPLSAIAQISRTIRHDVTTGQMRQDVGVDLNNLIQPVQAELAIGEPASTGELADALRAKIATRLSEGAVTPAAARALDSELDLLRRSGAPRR
jgi:hypothetical protein